MCPGYKSVSIDSLQDAVDAGYEVLSIPGTVTQENLCRAPPGTAMHQVCHRHPKISTGRVDAEVRARPRAAFYGMPTSYPEFVKLPLRGGYDGGKERRLFGLALCKDSEFREAFDRHILRMYEAGVVSR